MEEWMVMQKQDKNFSRVHRLNVKMLEYFFADIGYSLNYSAVLLNWNYSLTVLNVNAKALQSEVSPREFEYGQDKERILLKQSPNNEPVL